MANPAVRAIVVGMATARTGKCPHCRRSLLFMEDVPGATMDPACPKCGKAVEVKSPTLLRRDDAP